jgi:hypothetical protein
MLLLGRNKNKNRNMAFGALFLNKKSPAFNKAGLSLFIIQKLIL